MRKTAINAIVNITGVTVCCVVLVVSLWTMWLMRPKDKVCPEPTFTIANNVFQTAYDCTSSSEHGLVCPPTDLTRCLVTDQLRVEGSQWHARMHNQCSVTTPKLYVTLAFYDADGFRHGFYSFAALPLLPDERVRVDDKVPELWDWSARVFQVIDAPSKAEWFGAYVPRNQMESKGFNTTPVKGVKP